MKNLIVDDLTWITESGHRDRQYQKVFINVLSIMIKYL